MRGPAAGFRRERVPPQGDVAGEILRGCVACGLGAGAGDRLMSAARGVFCPGLGAGGRPGKRAKKAPQRRPVAVALGHDNFNFMMRFLWRAA
ncbi:hypothetical protein A3768_0770 [Ralstonia solanacearum]|nr:hypothetical protein A3768_0770 [Ralstonia solanacearum]